MPKSNIIATGLSTIPLEIKENFINRLKSQGIQNNLVLNVMQQVPRHLFVEPALKKEHMMMMRCQLVLIKQYPLHISLQK